MRRESHPWGLPPRYSIFARGLPSGLLDQILIHKPINRFACGLRASMPVFHNPSHHPKYGGEAGRGGKHDKLPSTFPSKWARTVAHTVARTVARTVVHTAAR